MSMSMSTTMIRLLRLGLLLQLLLIPASSFSPAALMPQYATTTTTTTTTTTLTATATPAATTATKTTATRTTHATSTCLASSTSSEVIAASLETKTKTNAKATALESALGACRQDVAKTCKVTVGVVPSSSVSEDAPRRLGLVATSNVRKGEVVLSVPYDERVEFTAATSKKLVYKDILEETYEGWTGEAGLIALQLLNEVARSYGGAAAEGAAAGAGVALPKRPSDMQTFIDAWVQALPTPKEMSYHPLLWSEEDQEVLQASSTTKVYRVLDDLEEDITWLVDNVFSKDRATFPEMVATSGSGSGSGSGSETIPCFSFQGYTWALAVVQSRAVFVDGALRLIPLLDFANHDDDAREINGGSMGTFGTVKGAELVANRAYKEGEEILCSYGPKSAADYLLEHGFCPPQAWKTAVSEITLELNSKDRFYEDKLDVLEFETYDDQAMDPVQSFDVVSAPGRDGEPDPAMIQFARLCQLRATDAFLLESIFRKEVWEFMSLPVSERNELAVVMQIIELCEKAILDLTPASVGVGDVGPEVCTQLRASEVKALTRTLEFLRREKEALDLKEYYQERRLKDLGLDSDWTSEDDDLNPDLGFGQTRAPGGADYDW